MTGTLPSDLRGIQPNGFELPEDVLAQINQIDLDDVSDSEDEIVLLNENLVYQLQSTVDTDDSNCGLQEYMARIQSRNDMVELNLTECEDILRTVDLTLTAKCNPTDYQQLELPDQNSDTHHNASSIGEPDEIELLPECPELTSEWRDRMAALVKEQQESELQYVKPAFELNEKQFNVSSNPVTVSANVYLQPEEVDTGNPKNDGTTDCEINQQSNNLASDIEVNESTPDTNALDELIAEIRLEAEQAKADRKKIDKEKQIKLEKATILIQAFLRGCRIRKSKSGVAVRKHLAAFRRKLETEMEQQLLKERRHYAATLIQCTMRSYRNRMNIRLAREAEIKRKREEEQQRLDEKKREEAQIKRLKEEQEEKERQVEMQKAQEENQRVEAEKRAEEMKRLLEEENQRQEDLRKAEAEEKRIEKQKLEEELRKRKEEDDKKRQAEAERKKKIEEENERRKLEETEEQKKVERQKQKELLQRQEEERRKQMETEKILEQQRNDLSERFFVDILVEIVRNEANTNLTSLVTVMKKSKGKSEDMFDQIEAFMSDKWAEWRKFCIPWSQISADLKMRSFNPNSVPKIPVNNQELDQQKENVPSRIILSSANSNRVSEITSLTINAVDLSQYNLTNTLKDSLVLRTLILTKCCLKNIEFCRHLAKLEYVDFSVSAAEYVLLVLSRHASRPTFSDVSLSWLGESKLIITPTNPLFYKHLHLKKNA